MRLRHVLVGTALVIVPSIVFGQPQSLGTLWQNAKGSVRLNECPPGDHDYHCRAIVVTNRNGSVHLGGGYMRVTLLWLRKGNIRGPEVLILGEDGGSGGDADLFAVSFTPRISFRKISGERFNSVTTHVEHSRLHIAIPFNIEFFNGAPHSGAIILPLPTLWTGNDFAVDLGKLTRRTYSVSELQFCELAISEELHRWAKEKFPSSRLYPPTARDGTNVTATALVEMMLSGHADQARNLLDQAWPHQWDHGDRPLGGEADFWAALCQAVVGQPSWKRFGLARLPHADLIERGAKKEFVTELTATSGCFSLRTAP